MTTRVKISLVQDAGFRTYAGTVDYDADGEPIDADSPKDSRQVTMDEPVELTIWDNRSVVVWEEKPVNAGTTIAEELSAPAQGDE